MIIFSGLRLVGPGRVVIGRGAFVNHDCTIDASADVTIGAGVSLANGVMVITSHHLMDDPARRGGGRELLPVVVGDGSWLGARAVVLPGVTVGPGVVVGAGSVVTRDCEPHSLYAGSPARYVRSLPEGRAGAETRGLRPDLT